MSLQQRGGLLASLFFWVFLCSVDLHAEQAQFVERAMLMELADHPQWRALLHAPSGKPRILDENFLLSSPQFSLQNELIASLRAFWSASDSVKARCRFPARYRWLGLQLQIPLEPLACPELLEFREKAPLESLYLAYSSENLMQASSMMGHVFMKFSGQDAKGQQLNHSISYFTEITGINVPKIIFDSLVTGKTGYFALTPYHEKLNYYLQAEQRNVWEYEIETSAQQRGLLHDHLWELKQTRLTYFFDDYNCATLLAYLLAFIEPEMFELDDQWVTPLRLVKAAHRHNLVQSTTVIPSSRWKLRMLTQTLGKQLVGQIAQAVKQQNYAQVLRPEVRGSKQFLEVELAGTYHEYLRETEELEQNNTFSAQLAEDRERLNAMYTLDASEFKSPLYTPEESQWGLSVYDDGVGAGLKLRWLPVSHGINDDNRQYFSENELKLSEFTFAWDAHSERLSLDEWIVYSMRSLIPYDALTQGISGRFEVAVKDHFNDSLEAHRAVSISGGAGFSWAWGHAIDSYALLGGGLGHEGHHGYAYLSPEVGVIIREANDFKTHINLQRVWNQRHANEAMNVLQLTQAKYWSQEWGLILGYERRWNTEARAEALSLELRHYY